MSTEKPKQNQERSEVSLPERISLLTKKIANFQVEVKKDILSEVKRQFGGGEFPYDKPGATPEQRNREKDLLMQECIAILTQPTIEWTADPRSRPMLEWAADSFGNDPDRQAYSTALSPRYKFQIFSRYTHPEKKRKTPEEIIKIVEQQKDGVWGMMNQEDRKAMRESYESEYHEWGKKRHQIERSFEIMGDLEELVPRTDDKGPKFFHEEVISTKPTIITKRGIEGSSALADLFKKVRAKLGEPIESQL